MVRGRKYLTEKYSPLAKHLLLTSHMEESRPLNSVLLSHIKTPTSGLAAFGTLSLGAESTDAVSTDTENRNVLHSPFLNDVKLASSSYVPLICEILALRSCSSKPKLWQ